MNRTPSIVCYLVLLVSIVGLDLWSKAAVFDFLGVSVVFDTEGVPFIDPLVPHPEHPFIENWFSFEAALNHGAFNGMFAGARFFLVAISVVAGVVTFLFVAIPRVSDRIVPIALGLVAGGAVGNLYDRWVFHAVRDFIKVFYVPADAVSRLDHKVWPNFNIADSAICVGVGLLFLREFLIWRAARRAAADGDAPSPGAVDTPEATPTPE